MPAFVSISFFVYLKLDFLRYKKKNTRFWIKTNGNAYCNGLSLLSPPFLFDNSLAAN